MLLTTSDLISNTHNMLSCITLMTDMVCCFLLKCNEMGEKTKTYYAVRSVPESKPNIKETEKKSSSPVLVEHRSP